MFTNINGKNYKVIMDNNSWINVMWSNIIGKIGLNSIPHPQLCKVSYIDATT